MTIDPNNIHIFKIDNNLFQSSTDTLKTAMDIFYFTGEARDDDDNIIGNKVFEQTASATTRVDRGFNGVDAYELASDSTGIIKYVQTNVNLLTQSNTGPITRFKIPVRIIGKESEIINSDDWRAIVLGGVYDGISHDRIYSDGTFDIFGHKHTTSYPELQTKYLNLYGLTETDYQSHKISYVYNSYLPEYQNAITQFSERQLPNIYFNELYSLSVDDDTTKYNIGERPEIESFVSRNGEYDFELLNLHTPKENQLTENPPPYQLYVGTDATGRDLAEGKYRDKSLFLRNYLTDQFINNSISDDELSFVEQKTKTLYFTGEAVADVLNSVEESSGRDIYQRYPMYACLRFPIETAAGEGSYTKIIKDNNLREEVLSFLKGTFVGGGLGGETTGIDFVRQADGLSFDIPNESVNQSVTSNEVSDPAVDLPDMLLSIMNSGDVSEGNDEMFISAQTSELLGMKNSFGSFRYSKTIPASKALLDSIKLMNSNLNDNYSPLVGDNDNFVSLLETLQGSIKDRTPEVIAYRIEKIAGPPIGDARRREKIQDVFMFNDQLSTDGNLYYYDTQVKYGEEYTYSIYAYMLVEGVRYKYSNLKLTRQIGTLEHDEFDSTGITPEINCLEFYEPTNNQQSEQLLNLSTNVYDLILSRDNILIPKDSAEIRLAYIEYFGNLARDEGYADDYVSGFSVWHAQTYGTEVSFTKSDFATNPRYAEAYNDYISWVQSINGEYVYQGDGMAIDGIFVEFEALIAESLVGVPISFRKEPDAPPSGYATNAQIKSANKYLADFHFEIEPTVKIVEVPIASNFFTILDSPPVACDITPYQRKDNSKIIGFYINKESFPLNRNAIKQFQEDGSKFMLYPTPISLQENELRETYLRSNNMIMNEIMKNPSISPEARVDVYRIDSRPKSLTDFDNKLVFSKNLQYEDDIYYNYSNCFYEEAISPNKKYYYLLKFVNENNVSGYISPIQIVELVDDGGYLYANFDALLEEDLIQQDERQASIKFKKLMQIIPSARHTTIVDSGLDLSADPRELIKNDEVIIGTAETKIWNKKFKFRLTSKKTGKKLDINVTYKLRNS